MEYSKTCFDINRAIWFRKTHLKFNGVFQFSLHSIQENFIVNKTKILPEVVADFIDPLFVCEIKNTKSIFVVEQSEFEAATDNKYVACKKLDYREDAETIMYSAQNAPRIIKYKRELQSVVLT